VALRDPVTCFSSAALPALVRSMIRVTPMQRRPAIRRAAAGGIAVLEPPLPVPPL
jgi:hypothetical protein